MAILRVKPRCLYCGVPTKRGRRGEHIIPEAIGGARTLNDQSERAVCETCNNGPLSQLDKELCSRSFLSVVASQEIDAHLWQVWDVDHSDGHLLLETRPSWDEDSSLQSLACYPQIIFRSSGPDTRGDLEEVRRFGNEEFVKVLWKAVRRCYERDRASGSGRLRNKKRALHLERINAGIVRDGYSLPPRIFTRRAIAEIARDTDGHSFTLRYVTDADRRFAFQSLEKMSEHPNLKNQSHMIGSRRPPVSIYFDGGLIIRALMKLGLNLIAAYCPNTDVSCDSFSAVLGVIRSEGALHSQMLRRAGFVHNEDIPPIRGARTEHTFRLAYATNSWHVYMCFFGGRLGAYAWIPGPNGEPWNMADIVAPLGSKNWSVTHHRLAQVAPQRIEWQDSTRIIPTWRLQNRVSSVEIEVVHGR